MAWRVFCVISLVLIVAAGSALLAEAGFTPWFVPVLAVALAFVVGGTAVRRRRGTRSALALPERRAKYHVRDLATNPPPGPKTEIPETESER